MGAADAINEWVLFHESRAINNGSDPNLEALVLHIGALYGVSDGDIERLRQKITHNKAELYAFSSDMQRLDYLVGILEEERNFTENRKGAREENGDDAPLARLRGITGAYAELRNEAEKIMLKNTL